MIGFCKTGRRRTEIFLCSKLETKIQPTPTLFNSYMMLSYVHYTERGFGPTIIWLHGYGEDQRIWPNFLEPFYDQYRCIMPDLPGFGQSALMEGEMNLAKVAKRLVAWTDELNIESAIWMGHSMGGYIGAEILHQFPEKVDGLCLVHSHVFSDTPDVKVRRRKAMEFILEHGSTVYAKELIPKLFSEYNRERLKGVVDELIERVSGFSAQTLAEGQRAMMNRVDHQQTLRDAKVPIGFVLGELDELFSYELAVQQTHLADHSIVHLLPEVGHMGMWEDRNRTQLALIDVLNSMQTIAHSSPSHG